MDHCLAVTAPIALQLVAAEVEEVPLDEELSTLWAIGVLAGVARDIAYIDIAQARLQAQVPSPLQGGNGGGLEV